MQAQRRQWHTQDEDAALRAQTAGYRAGKQAEAGDSDTQNEEDMQRALIAGYWAGMQAGGGDSDTQDAEHVKKTSSTPCPEPWSTTATFWLQRTTHNVAKCWVREKDVSPETLPTMYCTL
jgi:hypothetical protein